MVDRSVGPSLSPLLFTDVGRRDQPHRQTIPIGRSRSRYCEVKVRLGLDFV